MPGICNFINAFSGLVFLILIAGCGNGKPIVLEPQEGVSISVSGLKYVKSRGKVFGFVHIENESGDFVRLSNRELFLYSGSDSSRAFMKMPGEWEIDKGLINVINGKTINYQACWELNDFKKESVYARYVRMPVLKE